MNAIATLDNREMTRFRMGIRFALRAAGTSTPLDALTIRIKKTAEVSKIQILGTNQYMLNLFQMTGIDVKSVPASSGDIDATVRISRSDAKRLVAYFTDSENISVRIAADQHMRIGRVKAAHDIAVNHYPVELPSADHLESLLSSYAEKAKAAAESMDLSVSYANPKYAREALMGIYEVAPKYEPVKMNVNGRFPMEFSVRLDSDYSGNIARSLVMPIRFDSVLDAP